MSDDTLVRVEAPHFVAGLLVRDDGLVSYAAPILGWTVGWHTDELRVNFARKKWKATRLTRKNAE